MPLQFNPEEHFRSLPTMKTLEASSEYKTEDGAETLTGRRYPIKKGR
jgi:hypothetical protein